MLCFTAGALQQVQDDSQVISPLTRCALLQKKEKQQQKLCPRNSRTPAEFQLLAALTCWQPWGGLGCCMHTIVAVLQIHACQMHQAVLKQAPATVPHQLDNCVCSMQYRNSAAVDASTCSSTQRNTQCLNMHAGLPTRAQTFLSAAAPWPLQSRSSTPQIT